MLQAVDVLRRLELLVGAKERTQPREEEYFDDLCGQFESLDDLSSERIDQLLLAAGFNRPGADFHIFFRSLSDPYAFDASLSIWRQRCMVRFGNFRFPYRTLSSASLPELDAELGQQPANLKQRDTDPMDDIKVIPESDTPLLGYIAGQYIREIQERATRGDKLTEHESGLVTRFEQANKNGLRNTYEYCTMPFMDVYVATSMRESEEFFAVHRFTDQLFDGSDYRLRNVSFFDPTQSAHPDRIVKGIVEGLMLRRAAATVYLAQENDTLGKDSELAATLAQGKPVIAFVPAIDDLAEHAGQLVADSRLACDRYPEGPTDESIASRLTDRTKALDVELWFEFESRRRSGEIVGIDELADRLSQTLALRYERRAQTLLNHHPLALQVNISTGVTNGILVARSVSQCRDLLCDILEDNLMYAIRARDPQADAVSASDLEASTDWDRLLIESRTGSIHRVVTGDTLILNSFWNWYMGG